jgi:crossover junction endodeoxyribonuclease RuvC
MNAAASHSSTVFAREVACNPAHEPARKQWSECDDRRKLVTMTGDLIQKKTAWIRVLGVDPASAGPTGYGVVESDGRQCRMLHYGALQVAARRRKESLGAALQDIHALLCQLIEKFSPDALAVEGIFAALNVRTALRLAEVRGVVLLAAAQHGVAVHSYSPREVKASVAGYGHADKRQMQLMVRALLAMTETPEPADAADALAVALCHLQTERARQRFGLPAVVKPSRRSVRGMDSAAAVAVAAGPRNTTPSAPARIVSTERSNPL